MIETIKKRRSIRKIKEKEINDIFIKDILYAATLAPSAHNKQPWEFVVVKNKMFKNKIANLLVEDDQNKKKISSSTSTALCIKEAPILILVFNTSPEFPLFSHLSIGAAIENMLLCAEEKGLGSLWIGNIVKVEKQVQNLLQKNIPLVSAVALGYKNETPDMPDRELIDAITEWKE